MRIYLDDDDCPDAGDRETAARIIQEIALNDVVTRGSLMRPPPLPDFPFIKEGAPWP